MLIGIVEDDDIHGRVDIILDKLFDAVTAVFVNRHVNLRVFRLHLEWFVAYLLHFCVGSGKAITS